MKTPIQELIEKIKFARKMCDDPSMEMDIYHTLDVLTSEAEAMLEKEKEVIEKAFQEGTHQAQLYWDGESPRITSSEQYYNNIFNTKEK